MSVSGSEDSGSPVQSRNATTSRRKKSAAQIEFLERLYAENKYPSEEVRAKLSQQLGLSEKQMQIWFTHRRHKDRKDGVEDVKLTFYAMRHKGGEAHLDFMEELNSGKRPGGSLLGTDEKRSSGGRQPSHSGGEVSTGQEHMHGDSRRPDSESENSGLGQAEEYLHATVLKSSLKRGSLVNRKDGVYKRPVAVASSRSKAGAKDLELVAVSAVEAQLGESLRADSPQVGLEFDSLPPGAWTHLRNLATVPVVPVVPSPLQSRASPVVPQLRAPSAVQGRAPAASQGRIPLGVSHGRVGRIQSVGTY